MTTNGVKPEPTFYTIEQLIELYKQHDSSLINREPRITKTSKLHLINEKRGGFTFPNIIRLGIPIDTYVSICNCNATQFNSYSVSNLCYDRSYHMYDLLVYLNTALKAVVADNGVVLDLSKHKLKLYCEFENGELKYRKFYNPSFLHEYYMPNTMTSDEIKMIKQEVIIIKDKKVTIVQSPHTLRFNISSIKLCKTKTGEDGLEFRIYPLCISYLRNKPIQITDENGKMVTVTQVKPDSLSNTASDQSNLPNKEAEDYDENTATVLNSNQDFLKAGKTVRYKDYTVNKPEIIKPKLDTQSRHVHNQLYDDQENYTEFNQYDVMQSNFRKPTIKPTAASAMLTDEFDDSYAFQRMPTKSNQAINQAINQASNQAINQASNQAINQASNQPSNQVYDYSDEEMQPSKPMWGKYTDQFQQPSNNRTQFKPRGRQGRQM